MTFGKFVTTAIKMFVCLLKLFKLVSIIYQRYYVIWIEAGSTSELVHRMVDGGVASRSRS